MKNDKDGSIKNLKTFKNQKSVMLKLGEFLTTYSHLFSKLIHIRLNWRKRIAETKYYKMFYQMNIIIYQKFSPSSTENPFKNLLNAS